MLKLLCVVATAWLGLVGQARAESAQTAATVLEEVQRFYAGTKQLTAKFGQKVTNKAFGKPGESGGNVYLTKPGKMRWDYSDKKGKGVRKSFISNGKYVYVVEHDNKQVTKKKIEEDLMPVAVTFLTGKGDLSSEFNTELEASSTKDDIVLKLTPKTPSAQYKTLHLTVAKDNYRVKKSVVTDSADNTTELNFYQPDFEKAVDKKWFEFNPKTAPSYRMIDADRPPAKPTK
jgi:outer membrane lipoprotein carrier protein